MTVPDKTIPMEEWLRLLDTVMTEVGQYRSGPFKYTMNDKNTTYYLSILWFSLGDKSGSGYYEVVVAKQMNKLKIHGRTKITDKGLVYYDYGRTKIGEGLTLKYMAMLKRKYG